MESVSPVLIWFLLGIAFFVTELILPNFILFFFGIGAWGTAALLILTKLSLEIQVVICTVISLLSLILFRRWFRSFLFGDSNGDSDSVNAAFTSSTGIVIEAIAPPALGRVQYSGSFWRAVADEPIAKNTVVQIVERKNLVIRVRPLDEGEGT
ncbi:Membrane protein implicated in regulation of membrane protease activity [Candidatus Electrothrix marina]|uniref:Membrane protein implicated in regulation of membrane protease activity n=1 Tax=Candidatus Electrothrix marina TaxID=1859130 RepID=A0A3S3QQE6_9BACT|nr:Membrane protein implicated in regulation of membrane protease activity [Candidatus Electrothrix marina]